MSKALDELKGFVVFSAMSIKANNEKVGLTLMSTGISLSLSCLNILREPQYVIAFFDYDNPRLMLVPGKAEEENVLRLTKQGSDYRYIKSTLFRAELEKVAGKDCSSGIWFLPGRKIDVIRPTVVFDLKDLMLRTSSRRLVGKK